MRNKPRILFMIDGGNFFYMQKDILGWMIDPGKLKDLVASWGHLYEARYYLSAKNGQTSEAGEGYRKVLSQRWRYSVIEVPVKLIQTAEGPREKSNADVMIATDVCLFLGAYDMLVLLSGDSDFCYTLDSLKRIGKQVRTLSTRRMVATEMLECVGEQFYELSDLKETIARSH